MITRKELLKRAIATARIRITKREGDAMEQHISIITLGVKDLAVSRRYHARWPGLDAGFRGVGWR
jgi:hypothetical protein